MIVLIMIACIILTITLYVHINEQLKFGVLMSHYLLPVVAVILITYVVIFFMDGSCTEEKDVIGN